MIVVRPCRDKKTVGPRHLPHRLDVRRRSDDPTIGHYACTLPLWAKPDLKVGFPFRLRIDQVVPDATGRVIVHPHAHTSAALDPTTRNNSAKVVVNPAD